MEYLATYHPAYIKRDSRSGPAFIYDIQKAANAAHGLPVDDPPIIEINPTTQRLQELFEAWNGDWAFDLETTRSKPHRVLSIAFAGFDGHAFAYHTSRVNPKRLKIVAEEFKKARRIIVQNGAFDLPIIAAGAIKPNWDAVFDTMLAGYLLEPEDYTNLSHLASLYLNVRPWKHLNEEDPLRYNALDAAHTYSLYVALSSELAERGQLDFFTSSIMPLLHKAIIPLNSRGITLDVRKRNAVLTEWNRLYESWSDDVKIHFGKLSKDLGREILPPLGAKGGTSQKQLKQVLYTDLSLPAQLHSSTRAVTVDKHALAKLETLDNTGTVTLLLRRSRLKENEVHLNVVPDRDGRVRARYVLGGDEKHRELTEKGSSRARDRAPGTGRLASRSPNHQNVPDSAKIIYVPSQPDWWLVEADYRAIEPRITAYLAGDKRLWEAINSGDIYEYVNGVLGAGDRRMAKRAFLGWSYRMGERKLHLTTGIPFKECKEIIQQLNSTFPAVVKHWDFVVAHANFDGYITNAFGRMRPFRAPIDVPKVCNYPVQSAAADTLFQAMLSLGVELGGSMNHEHLLATVHDSVLAEGPEWEPLADHLKAILERPVPQLGNMVVPVKITIGKNWGEMKGVTCA